jgi:hypothetical protein
MARDGHEVIATAQTWPQVTASRAKSKAPALPKFRVEKLDLLDPYDVGRACKWDIQSPARRDATGDRSAWLIFECRWAAP